MDEKYFVAKITTDMVDSESGKVKKIREEKLENFVFLLNLKLNFETVCYIY